MSTPAQNQFRPPPIDNIFNDFLSKALKEAKRVFREDQRRIAELIYENSDPSRRRAYLLGKPIS